MQEFGEDESMWKGSGTPVGPVLKSNISSLQPGKLALPQVSAAWSVWGGGSHWLFMILIGLPEPPYLLAFLRIQASFPLEGLAWLSAGSLGIANTSGEIFSPALTLAHFILTSCPTLLYYFENIIQWYFCMSVVKFRD